jgi:hypothetical protein
VTNKFGEEGIAVLDMSQPKSEQNARRWFAKARKAEMTKVLAQHHIGDTVGAGVIVYRIAESKPLTTAQVEGIMNGTTRLYVFLWATWKDSHKRSGTMDACYWLQAPTSRELLNQELVWRSCTEPL